MNQQIRDNIHLYLPYNLRVRFDYNGLPHKLKSIDLFRNQISILGKTLWGEIDFHEITPYFRPLSSLVKEISVPEYNGGEPFVPMNELGRIHHMNVIEFNMIKQNYDSKVWILHENIRLAVAETLFRWHFWLWDQSLFNKGDIIRIVD